MAGPFLIYVAEVAGNVAGPNDAHHAMQQSSQIA